MTDKIKQIMQKKDQARIKNSLKSKEKTSNLTKAQKNILNRKSLNPTKKVLFLIKLLINLILVLSMVSLINCQRELRFNSSFIIIKLNTSSYFLSESFLSLPDKVYIDNVEQERNKWENKYINISSKYQAIKLEWNDKLLSTSKMFMDLKQVYEVDLSGFDSSFVTDTSYMFKGCDFILSINFNGFTTSSVKNMQAMFYWMGSIGSIDVSHFDTSQVTDMSLLFNKCGSLNHIDVSNFNTSSVTSMAAMFGDSGFLFLNLSNFDTRKVQNMESMICYCRHLTSVDISSFDTSSCGSFLYMFSHSTSLKSLNLSHFDTSRAGHLIGMFLYCESLEVLDISSFKTGHMWSFWDMFNGCKKITSINLDNFDTTNIVNMAQMFKDCHSLKSLDLSIFKTSKLETMQEMFANCVFLTSVVLSSFDTSKVNNMEATFSNCVFLNPLNISNFRTSNVKTMKNMFFNCASLTSLNILNFDTTKVADMTSMFEKCVGLKNLDISTFYPNNNEIYSKMFFGCTNLLYVNFYNYYENENTTYNDIITEAHPQIILCIHVKKEARIYQSYPDHLDIECLRPDKDPTTIITTHTPTEKPTTVVTTHTPTEKPTTIVTTHTPTEKPTTIVTTHTPAEKITTNVETTNKPSEKTENVEKTELLEENQQKTNSDNKFIFSSIPKFPELDESKSSSFPINTESINSINSYANNIVQTTIISSEYTIVNNVVYLFNRYNNTLIYNYLVEFMLQDFHGISGQKMYIKGENGFMFEITTEENEKVILKNKIRNQLNSSVIDLGECSNLLKNKYFPNNDNVSLILLKFEKMTKNSTEKNIQLEVYEPFNQTKLDISICRNTSIDFYIPTQLSEKTQKLIEYLEQLGYDVFNLNSPFYTDFCTQYTTPEGTDMTLDDRKKYIYEAIMNEVNCQENCQFSSYDSEKRYLECSCNIHEDINTIDYKKFNLKKMYNTFYDVLKYSNYKVIFCYKLVFTLKNFDFNKGCWIIFILFILYMTQLYIYLCKKISPFKLYIARDKFGEKIEEKKKHKNELKIHHFQKETNVNVLTEKLDLASNSQFPPKKTNSEKNKRYEGKNSDTNILKSKLKDNFSRNNDNLNDKKKKYSKFVKNSTKTNDTVFKENDIINKEDKKKEYLTKAKLDDFELNNLDYEEALMFDKRSFIQMFWSVLKREHILLFTFFFHNDYNLYYAKNARFIFLLATDMAMNVFFFSDETMNKIYLSYGEYDFVQQIPQIIYSKLLSNLIEVFLCFSMLTDKHYYQIKALTKSDKKEIFDIIKCARTKLIIFFVFTFLVFLFYWYLVTAFCAVYINTQIIFIKNSLLSYAFGFITTFIIYFFPSLLRYISLRCKCCNLKFMYTLSEIIPIF